MTDPRIVPPEETGGYRAVTDGDLREAMELGEFLTGLGVVMRLPTKPTGVQKVVDAPKAPRKGRHRRWLIPIALVGSIAAIALAVPAVMRLQNDPLPEALMGQWHTRSPKFADRGFEISSSALHMRRGLRASDVAVLPIRRVQVSPRGIITAVVIDYEENGVTQSLDLTMHGSGRATTVEIRNQADVVWRKRAR